MSSTPRSPDAEHPLTDGEAWSLALGVCVRRLRALGVPPEFVLASLLQEYGYDLRSLTVHKAGSPHLAHVVHH